MKLRALSHYHGDKKTRFGDCILLHNTKSLVVYDCGHAEHANVVKAFLLANRAITEVNLVVSHNDSDHTDGFISLMEHLSKSHYTVTLYSSLYLKSARKVLELLDDNRRTLPATKERILELFDNIKEIVEKAQEYGFLIKDGKKGAEIATCCIVGPTEEEFVEVVTKAIESGSGAQIEGENVMNAASIQIDVKLDNAETMLLCGDATPEFLHNLDSYDVIHLPHHGKLDNAIKIFDELRDSYSKTYFVSDNTGSGTSSGGSDDLVKYMQKELYSPALNTKDREIIYPYAGSGNSSTEKKPGVKLGEMDYWLMY
jgi:hypothetical protein